MSGVGTGPLSGIRILDLCWVGAGSYATRLLADLGADVIKVESHRKVDGLRLAGPFAPVPRTLNTSGYFADRNSSKRSITIDLTTAEGSDLVLRLLEHCDAIANNFSPGVMERFGLGADTVLEQYPGIVYLSMSMMGLTGPKSHYIGFGQNISATAGLHHLSGEPGRLPVGSGTHFPDHIPNPTHAAFALLAAVRHAGRTGVGQAIDISQAEPMLAHLGPQLLETSLDDRDPGPDGNRHREDVPHGVYPCSGDDVWIAIAVKDDVMWAALRATLEPSEGATEAGDSAPESWSTAAGRQEDRVAVDAWVARRTRTLRAEELDHLLAAAGVPAAPVLSPKGVREDAQLAHRGHWVELPHAEMGATVYNNVPFRFANRRVGPERAAPLIGEHTVEVLSTFLGMSAEEIDALAQSGVLR